MAHFSNGTEGMRYNEQICERCVHWQNHDELGHACPVFDAHFLYQDDDEVAGVLDLLIPRPSLYNEVCAMFHATDKAAAKAVEAVRVQIAKANAKWETDQAARKAAGGNGKARP